ncbi:MAG: class I SAM-dependent methyltransferase [Aggregatilineales bacterium]
MDQATIQRLNAINQTFYETTAQEFDQTRGRAWQGWIDLLPHLPTDQHNTNYNVLDVGCGNGRFGVFLAENLDYEIAYHGMDNNRTLLDVALKAVSTAPGTSTTIEYRDIVNHPPDSGLFDLIVLFGVIHHIPGFEQRKHFMHTLAQRLKPDGLLVFASWRFYEFERFQERVVSWEADLAQQVEKHDYLLDWRRGEVALRYCHYVDDDEQQALIEATGLKEIATYRADGYQNRLNCYSVLKKA